jgi:hypothetical protein
MHTKAFENNLPTGATFETVWAILQENALQQKENDRQMKETDRRMQETDRRMQETRKSQEETDRQMKETDKLISWLGNRFGELIEHLVAPNIMNKFNALDFNFTRCSTNFVLKEPGSPQALAEVDVMLENGDIVIAVEVKAKPEKSDVEDHIQRMEKLRYDANRRGYIRRYRGAIAGAILSDSLQDYILKQGFYLIEQTGDTVRINIPEGFSPREWYD